MALFRRVRRPTYSRSYAPDLLTRAFTGSYLARVALGPQVEARFLVWPEVIFCRLNCRAVDPARPTPFTRAKPERLSAPGNVDVGATTQSRRVNYRLLYWLPRIVASAAPYLD